MKTIFKKTVSLLLSFLFVFSVPINLQAAYTDETRSIITVDDVLLMEVDVRFNGSYIRFDYPAYLDTVEKRVIVPLRPIFESLGVPSADINWNEDTGTVLVRHTDGTSISIRIGDEYAYVNGFGRRLTSTARLINDRVYVPLRFVSETLSAQIFWDEEMDTANIILE